MDNRVEITRGPDGDLITVNGHLIPGASLMFQDARRVVISIPTAESEDGPQVRRIALESDL